MKKIFYLLLIGTTLSLIGCGSSVSFEDYSTTVEELEILQENYDCKVNELQILQANYDANLKELTAAQQEIKDLQNKFEKEHEKLVNLQAELENAVTLETETAPPSVNIDVKYKDLIGRGQSDSGREEPSYKNIFGYIVVGYNEESSLYRSDSYINTPWMIPTYEKDKQFYVENGTVEHKTEIVVLEQELEHDGYGAYSGYLLVKKIDSDDQFYINVNNFITKSYWSYNDVNSAISIGYCIAEYHQISDYYPVNKSNKKVELTDGFKVLLVGKTGLYGGDGPDHNTNSIEAIVFKEWEYGYGGVSVFFNPQDLSIVY